jgi:hypothetical protein
MKSHHRKQKTQSPALLALVHSYNPHNHCILAFKHRILCSLRLIVLLIFVIKRALVGSWRRRWRRSWCSGWRSTSCYHLNRNTSTERACSGGILTPDHAYVLLAGYITGAGLSSRDRGLEGKIHHGIGPVTAVGSVNLSGDIDGLPVSASSVGVDHARVWAGTVTVDLVKGHLDLSTSGDLWELASVLAHDNLGTSGDVILSTLKCLLVSTC